MAEHQAGSEEPASGEPEASDGNTANIKRDGPA
jgi:hypothetical protein